MKELGLTDNEVRIYLLLLRQGMMNPSDIAEKLGFHRGYVYDALERMQEKGVINSLRKDNKKHYQATHPESVAEMLRLRLENFQKILPKLARLPKEVEEETMVELHKGSKVYRTLLKDIVISLKRNEEVYLIGIDEEVLLTQVEPIYLKQYLNVIRDRNVKELIIIAKGKKRLKHRNLEYRELGEEYIGKTAQIIYGNKVALFLLGTPYYLIAIENRDVADTYRKQFHLLWQLAKK